MDCVAEEEFRVSTNLSFDSVQRTGLDAGLVDVKICAIDDT